MNGSTPRHEDHDGTGERGARASITIDVFRVGKPRTDTSPLSDAG